MKNRRGLSIVLLASAGLAGVGLFVGSVQGLPGTGDQVQVPATAADFFLNGTQPNTDSLAFEPVQASNNCSYCHGEYNATVAPFDTWVVSMMGQSARDPVWHAALAIANQDVNMSGGLCIRCHAPGGWLAGHSEAADLSQLTPDDFDGVNCHFCHRVVNPVEGSLSAVGYPANNDPTPDPEVLAPLIAAGILPSPSLGSASYVVDPKDVRRGPFNDVPMNFHGGPELIYSPYHSNGAMCGTCHDVNNPAYSRLADGSLALNALGTPHPTMQGGDMFGEQRTYSEWLKSSFPTTGVSYPDGRFGGNHATGVMKSCQDCHMPDQQGGGCVFYDGDITTERPNVPQHSFAGANTWVLRAVQTQMGADAEYFGLTQILRHYKMGDVYIAGSLKGEMIKVGFSVNIEKRHKSINVSRFGGFDDWEVLFYGKVLNAGMVEQISHSELKPYQNKIQFMNGSHLQESKELYRCGYPKAKETVLNVVTNLNLNFIETKEESKKIGLYSFRNLRGLD